MSKVHSQLMIQSKMSLGTGSDITNQTGCNSIKLRRLNSFNPSEDRLARKQSFEDSTYSETRIQTDLQIPPNSAIFRMTRAILMCLMCLMGAFALGTAVAMQASVRPCESGRDLGIYCGRGSTGECPGSSYCDIQLTDIYASCCCNDSAAVCPDCTLPFICKVNPCEVTTCPGVPHAVCRPDYCGGCNARFYVGEENVTEKCTVIEPCSRQGGTNLGIGCGRGTTGQCPGSSYCDIHPTDIFATCCCNNSAAFCPNCTHPFNCLLDPCQVSSCPAFPQAECLSDYCGGCNARFILRGRDVTEDCNGCQDPAATCPGCTYPVKCLTDPCDSCPHIPWAKCTADYCGGCNARFFIGRKDVTKICRRGLRTPL